MGQRWPKVAQVVWQADPQRYSSFGLLQTSLAADVANKIYLLIITLIIVIKYQLFNDLILFLK